MDPQQAQQQAMHMMAVMFPMMMFGWLIMMTVLIIPLWQISKKAGLSGFLSLLTLIPGIGILIALYIIAFSQWRVIPAANLVSYPPPQYPPTSYPPQGRTL
jgi:hypothetical protein